MKRLATLGLCAAVGGAGVVGGAALREHLDSDIHLTPTTPDGRYQAGIGVDPEWEPTTPRGDPIVGGVNAWWDFCDPDNNGISIRVIGDDAVLDITPGQCVGTLTPTEEP